MAFLLLFRGGHAGDRQQSPEKWQAHMQQWMEWMSVLNEQGKFAGAQPLEPDGRVIRGNTQQVSNGPFMEAGEMLGGYLICKASSYEEAIEISRGCPILGSPGGIVEIRKIQDTEL